MGCCIGLDLECALELINALLPTHSEVNELASLKLFLLTTTFEELHVSRFHIFIFFLLFLICMASTVFTCLLVTISYRLEVRRRIIQLSFLCGLQV